MSVLFSIVIGLPVLFAIVIDGPVPFAILIDLQVLVFANEIDVACVHCLSLYLMCQYFL